MLRVGLTGGAGSGKSTAAAIFRELGAAVSQSDEIGRAMMQPGQAVYDRIVDHFGSEIVRADGSLDRQALARIAFEDGRVEELNSIVHPPVIAAQSWWMAEVEREHPAAVAVVESALLFETRHGAAGLAEAAEGSAPWRTRFDRIVLVMAPEDVRLERYLERYLERCFNRDLAHNLAHDLAHDVERTTAIDKAEARERARRDAQARFRAQMGEEEKAALSDYLLRNDRSPEELRSQVEKLYTVLRNESADRLAGGM